jgi:hypothetical protein
VTFAGLHRSMESGAMWSMLFGLLLTAHIVLRLCQQLELSCWLAT